MPDYKDEQRIAGDIVKSMFDRAIPGAQPRYVPKASINMEDALRGIHETMIHSKGKAIISDTYVPHRKRRRALALWADGVARAIIAKRLSLTMSQVENAVKVVTLPCSTCERIIVNGVVLDMNDTPQCREHLAIVRSRGLKYAKPRDREES